MLFHFVIFKGWCCKILSLRSSSTLQPTHSKLKAIDFFKLDERLNDIVGSAYYVAPEVLHRSYHTKEYRYIHYWLNNISIYLTNF